MPKSGRRSTLHRRVPDALAKRIGARIRALRIARAISFDAFVEECEVGRGYVSELERGLVVPSVTVLAKIAAVLEVTVADLLVEDTLREELFRESAGLRDEQIRTILEEVRRLKSSHRQA